MWLTSRCRRIIHISGPLLGIWLATRIAYLTPDPHVLLSWELIVVLWAFTQFLPCHHVQTREAFFLSKWGHGFASSFLDLTVATSSWLDTADLSDHGPVIALQVCLGQWTSFTGMELCTQALSHGHRSCKRGGRMWEIVVAPWTSSR